MNVQSKPEAPPRTGQVMRPEQGKAPARPRESALPIAAALGVLKGPSFAEVLRGAREPTMAPIPPKLELGERRRTLEHDKNGRDKENKGDEKTELDPIARQTAALGLPVRPIENSIAPNAAAATPSLVALEDLHPGLVRRIAWGGDKRRGSASIDLGSGPNEGTTLLVHAEDGRVRVEVKGSEGPELDRLRERLAERLGRRGLDVEGVT